MPFLTGMTQLLGVWLIASSNWISEGLVDHRGRQTPAHLAADHIFTALSMAVPLFLRSFRTASSFSIFVKECSLKAQNSSK